MRGTPRLLICGLLVAAIAACGDNSSGAPDARPKPGSDAMTDANTNPPANFTAFVIDQINANTKDNVGPIPFADFADLPDTDGNNADAYSSLFLTVGKPTD